MLALSGNEAVAQALKAFKDMIMQEVLAVELSSDTTNYAYQTEEKLSGDVLAIGLTKHS